MRHLHLIDCDSTQDVLKEQLSQGTSSESILVSCENQLKGRGRGDHTWASMSGTLCFSLSLSAHSIPSFTAIEISVLVARFFESKGRVIKLKWPNDLFNREDKKCAGVLVQSHSDIMMAGIGLNLFSESPEFGGVYEASFEVEKKSWCHELAEFILKNRYQNSADLTLDWEKRCRHLNERVSVEEAGVVKTGIFVGLGIHGEAVLRDGALEHHLYNGSLRISPTRLS
jgi:biotin-[acetyl-CoA-carboxylase] ligase BirA-like protein